VVRVAGFTAYFVTLRPDLQREIVSRAEAAL
jgi:pyruvate-formate lyase